jgi:hypothetical protein
VFGAQGADLAIIFDTTGSMAGAIGDAKAQATELAETWLDFFRNGRVALVEYKDEGDPFVARIDIGLTSDVAAFQNAVNGLTASGGGDTPEAQLSGVMRALNGLDWADGATKVTIVITDAPGKDPEPTTGYTREQVSQRALEIDPVAIYGVDVANWSAVSDFMQPMADDTAGQVFVLQPGQSLSDALFDVLDAAHAAPVAKLRGPYMAETGSAITFSARDSFDASATITGYEWDFDADGNVDTTTTAPEATYTYPSEYAGLVSVRVLASDGLSALATAEVTVDDIGLADDLPLAPTAASATVTGPNEVTVEWTPDVNDRADGYFVMLEDGTVVGLRLASDGDSLVVEDVNVSQSVTLLVSSGNQFGRSAGTSATTGASEAPIVTERISESSQHGQGNGLSHEAYISADGRYVTFESEASDLVTGDTNAAADVFVHDRVSDTTTRVSVASDGTQANGSSEDPTISPDGRYVAYRSAATNLVSGDTNNKVDIFVFDRQTSTTTRVSLASDGTQANGSSDSAVVARDGAAVVFRSFGRLVPGDTNGETDIYLRDLVAGTTSRVSVASDGSQADGASDGPTISDDGQVVAFDSVASNLVAGDTNAVRDVFVHEVASGTTSRVSLASDGTQGDADSWEPTLDATGATVAFTSSATTLVAGDTNAKDDVFVVTRSTGAIVRASLGDDEAQSTNHADETSLSADGTLLAFYSTASNLVAGDTNNKGDVFVRDLVDGSTTRWSLTSDGLEGNDRSANPTISGDGGTVAFHSFATNLVPDDTNAVADVFVRGPDQ